MKKRLEDWAYVEFLLALAVRDKDWDKVKEVLDEANKMVKELSE